MVLEFIILETVSSFKNDLVLLLGLPRTPKLNKKDNEIT
tara:strand:+ start:239 stop:355 length:117 start_codon:yes stop_codon:yes gene_type:complete